MAKNKLNPQGNTIKCAACGHGCIFRGSEYPLEGTPPDKIHVAFGNCMSAMYCTGCGCFTIYCITQEQFTYYSNKYYGEKLSK